ncbi:epididymal sperm-binding protein 1-like isoform X2 [Montipora capricornis]|uniref:epididymal sperm-binding protein 1-like isoform X2 n=1 Tax=Montipora capricornis TaxID=246305 RepID=UPI0035F11B88
MLLKISLILAVCAFLINLPNAASDIVDCIVKTTQGKCCVFPFTYGGKVYQSCTTKNHDKPWCSTTANYDQDGQWGNCLSNCIVKTTQGKCCVFPFTYGGKVYQSCTTKNHDKPWCSTTANYDQDGQWGNCLSNCIVKTTQGKCCVFPFTYGGKVYQSCTTKNHDKPWCSTTANYDKDGQWGNCLSNCIVKTTQGKCCVFPFTYGGKVYQSCTTKNHDKPWCSTTANYDQDGQWGNCLSISWLASVTVCASYQDILHLFEEGDM